LIVEYRLSFEDYLDARNEKEVVHEKPKESIALATRLILLFSGVALIASNPISTAILSSGALVVLATFVASHFLKRRIINRRNNELRSDFEQFSSGKYTFEANTGGWRLCSERDKQVHDWEELLMIKESPRVLYLVTHTGACTLPKDAFSREQLSQLKAWLEL
jgi:hypothetical protein